MNNVQKIIKEICDENGISFKLVSKDWVSILEKDNKYRYIIGYKFPLNNQSSSKICDDKFALYEVIKEFKIPVVEHNIVYNDYDIKKLNEYCKQFNYDMVIKNNCGTCGNDMYHVNSFDEIISKMNLLFAGNKSVSISPYYEIKTEYRIIVLNDNVELVYGKKKPIVVGDGKSTIYELLCLFNQNYFMNIKDDNLNRVLKEGEIFEYNWQFNLSKGAMPFLLENTLLEDKLKIMAIEIAQILGIKFASIDIIELIDGTLLLLEVNSGVMMDNFSKSIDNGKNIVKSIYTKVINEMFK